MSSRKFKCFVAMFNFVLVIFASMILPLMHADIFSRTSSTLTLRVLSLLEFNIAAFGMLAAPIVLLILYVTPVRKVWTAVLSLVVLVLDGICTAVSFRSGLNWLNGVADTAVVFDWHALVYPVLMIGLAVFVALAPKDETEKDDVRGAEYIRLLGEADILSAHNNDGDEITDTVTE